MKRRPSCLLPDAVKPIKYKVHLTPNPNFWFSGSIEMLLQVQRPVKEIVMHAFELKDFHAVQLSSVEDGWTRQPVEPPRIDARARTITLNFREVIPFATQCEAIVILF